MTDIPPQIFITLLPSGPSKDEEKEDVEDEVVMNNLMHDIKEGFIQRRLPDGGFKVNVFLFSII